MNTKELETKKVFEGTKLEVFLECLWVLFIFSLYWLAIVFVKDLFFNKDQQYILDFKNHVNLSILLMFIFQFIMFLIYIDRYNIKKNFRVIFLLWNFFVVFGMIEFILFFKFPKNILEISILFLILLLIPFILTFLSEKMIHFLYSWFFGYDVYEIKNTDLFTMDNEYKLLLNKQKNKKKIGVDFLLILKNQKEKNGNFQKIKQAFANLIFLWYAFTYNKILFRFLLPGLSLIFSMIFFLSSLYLLDISSFGEYGKYNNIMKMSYVVVFLVVLYFSMLYHINMFLDPYYYIKSIDKLFRKSHITFKITSLPNKILLYMDKYFLFKGYDHEEDNLFTINEDESFKKFILESKFDHEGRNNIINIFVSLFMIIYLTIFVEVLVDSETDKFIKKFSLKIKDHQIIIKEKDE